MLTNRPDPNDPAARGQAWQWPLNLDVEENPPECDKSPCHATRPTTGQFAHSHDGPLLATARQQLARTCSFIDFSFSKGPGPC